MKIAKAQKHPEHKTHTRLISFESDEFHSATAATVQEAQKVVEAGFEYVCDFNSSSEKSN